MSDPLFISEDSRLSQALRFVGIDIGSVDELVNTSVPYPAAIPVLMKFLNSSGTVIAKPTFSPYGLGGLNGGGATEFAGYERDFALGSDYLDYDHARYYSPLLGRFLSVDPVIGEPHNPQSWNRYAYVRNNPTNATDPDGRLCEPCFENQLKNEQLAVIQGRMSMDQYLDIQRARFNIAMTGMTVMGIAEAASAVRAVWVLARAGFSASERGVISSSIAILNTGGKELVAAFESGESRQLVIEGQKILVEPEAPISGITLQGEKAFVLGKDAFTSSAELAKTILHEMYRLAFQGGTEGAQASVTAATRDAFAFAEKAYDVLSRLKVF